MSSWKQLNGFEQNQEYTEKLLKYYKIHKYQFTYDVYGNLCLLIEINLKKYRIVIDEIHEIMIVYGCNVHNQFAKFTKEHMVEKVSYKDECIWNSLKWVVKDSKID